ncbi:MAG: helix-turn-helix transcriptional regulator [Lachnospiraceae bacterium]|nr:helix-turn-helix transcriptional regulator [Lachnospiraceae bacterium]
MKKTEELNALPKPHTTLKTNLQCSLIIALCFLWTSTGYLSWMYQLLDFAESSSVDWLTEVIGYLFQAFGIFIFSLVIKRKKSLLSNKSIFITCIGADFIFIILATLSNHLLFILIWGYLMNFVHGIIAGFYLTLLATQVELKYRSIVFGGAYAASSIASWLISLLNQSNFLHSEYALITYGIFICITIGLIIAEKEFIPFERITFTGKDISAGTIALAGLTIVLVSLTRGIGFYFPIADISAGISLEFSRAFYAIGLIIAGIIGDRTRKYGAISCLAALFFPFAMIALSTEIGISIILWILGYFFFGFLAVFRVILFSDIARTKENLLYVAGFGLMFGRIGDAAGNLTGIILNDKLIPLVIVSSICFVVTFIVFFLLYNKLYMPIPQPLPSQEERLNAFIQKYELSLRETEVLNLIREGASNGEISAKLFISENTVKFHVRNILKKTGCSNRTELLTALNRS